MKAAMSYALTAAIVASIIIQLYSMWRIWNGFRNVRKRPFDPRRRPAPDDMGFFCHPDVPGDDEGDDVAGMLTAMGYEWNLAWMEIDAPDLYEAGLTNHPSRWADWSPTPPDGTGWQLVMVGDTEDGPQALFVRPMQRGAK